MIRIFMTASVIAMLTGCAAIDGQRGTDLNSRSLSYVPAERWQAPLFSDATVTGDTKRDDE